MDVDITDSDEGDEIRVDEEETAEAVDPLYGGTVWFKLLYDNPRNEMERMMELVSLESMPLKQKTTTRDLFARVHAKYEKPNEPGHIRSWMETAAETKGWRVWLGDCHDGTHRAQMDGPYLTWKLNVKDPNKMEVDEPYDNPVIAGYLYIIVIDRLKA